MHALLPAAGKSSRMGRPKLTLPAGDSTVIGRLVDTLRRCGVENVVVVTGPEDGRLGELAQNSGARLALLPKATPDMRSTVQFGLRWLLNNGPISSGDFFLLIPADHPALTDRALSDLLKGMELDPNWSIYIPTFEGVRGHPAVLPVSLVDEIEKLPENTGINELVRRQASRTKLVAVSDPSILWDLDTQADYESFLATLSSRPPDSASPLT
jgi:molybdenum cofactor cytidylyltransferase